MDAKIIITIIGFLVAALQAISIFLLARIYHEIDIVRHIHDQHISDHIKGVFCPASKMVSCPE